MTRCHSASSTFSGKTWLPMPALLTRRSTTPISFRARSTRSSTTSSLEMSPTQPTARIPSAVRLTHRLRELLLADIDHDDGRARRAEMPGARETDAGSSAGDERDPAGQAVERGDVRGRHVVASPFRSDGARSTRGDLRHGRASDAPRDGGDERPGVGMLRSLEDLERVARFHELAVAQDVHSLGEVPDHGEIVGDEDDREPAAAEAVEEVEKLRLRALVDRGGRLVGDEDGRPCGKGAGDARPLALTAGQLAGLLAGVVGADAHSREELQRPRASLGRRGLVVESAGLGNGRQRRHPRVETAVRILKHHLHFAAHRTGIGAAIACRSTRRDRAPNRSREAGGRTERGRAWTCRCRIRRRCRWPRRGGRRARRSAPRRCGASRTRRSR